MTKKEFENRMADIDLKIHELKSKKEAIKKEYADSIGGQYDHLIGKWVKVTYRNYTVERSLVGFWKGVSIQAGSLIMVEVYKAKKDNTQSSRTDYDYITDLVSVVEIEH